MKKQELRIGIIMFDSVREKEVTLELRHFKELEIAEKNFFDRYKRIILDAIWLERFGFVFTIESCFSNGVLEIRYSELENQCFIYEYLESAGRSEILQLDYAHQLQNLYFALTKTELTLKP